MRVPLFFCLFFGSLFSESAPSPFDLEPGWYEYLAPKGEVDRTHIDPFMERLKSAVDSEPDEEKKTLQPYLDKIAKAISSFELAAEKRPFLPEKPFVKKESYTLAEILDLFATQESLQLTQSEDSAEWKEGERHLTALETSLLKVRKEYQDAEAKSPEKLRLALQLIQLRLTHETAKRELSSLKETIEKRKLLLAKLQEELEDVQQKLSATPQDHRKAETEIKNSALTFQKLEEGLKAKEAAAIGHFAFTPKSEEEKIRNRNLSTETTVDAISAASASLELLQSELTLELTKLALDGLPKNQEALQKQLSKWNDLIEKVKKEAAEWRDSLEKSIDRAEEWLSVNSDKALVPVQEETLKLAQTGSANLSKLESSIQKAIFMKSLVEKTIGKKENGVSHFLFNFKERFYTSFIALQDKLSTPLISYGETIITLGSLLKFFLILIGSFLIARIVDALLFKLAPEERQKKAVLWRVSRLFQYAIMTAAFFIALSALGFDLSNVVLLISALGVGLGFGLQTLFNNFVSGLIILFESQIKVGDYVELESGVIGEVKEINVRSTYIHTNDGIDIIVPNSEFTQDRVINWTLKEPYRRVQIPFSVAYDSDKELVKRVVTEAVAAVPLTLKQPWIPEPKVYLTDFGASSLNFKVNVWVDAVATRRTSHTHSAYLWAIHDALKKNQIEIPYPQFDLHIKKGDSP